MTDKRELMQFNFGALLKQAWKLFTENIGLLLACAITDAIVETLARNLSVNMGWELRFSVLGFFQLSFDPIASAVAAPFFLGFVAVVLKIVRSQNPTYGVFFSGFRRFLPALMAYLLIGFFGLIGAMLCILPGILVLTLYLLTFFYLYDEHGGYLSFWSAMEQSRVTAMANLGQFVLLFLVLFAVNFVGLCACIVGLLVSVPVSLLMLALAYEQIGQGAGQVAVDLTAT